jgi:hypothetical protein
LPKVWLLYRPGLAQPLANVCAGFVVQIFGYNIGFVTLAAIAFVDYVFCVVDLRNKTGGKYSP